jgi:hypothetical protein
MLFALCLFAMSYVYHEKCEAYLTPSLKSKLVMLGADLAGFYGVETKILKKAVNRHLDRFPEDPMFQLTAEEAENVRFQSGTSEKQRGGRRYLLYAFTEQGVAMLSWCIKQSGGG